MIPGPKQIIACAHCGALEYYTTLRSGNTFGAKLYSDGKQIAPMLPQTPPYIECHACHKTYWLKDAAKVGTLPWSSSRDDKGESSWAEAPRIQSPCEKKFYEAIERLGADGSAKDLRQLRILAWHKRNDAYRKAPKAHVNLTPLARKNMENLSVCERRFKTETRGGPIV